MEPKTAARVMQSRGARAPEQIVSRTTFDTFLGPQPLDGVLGSSKILTLDGVLSASYLTAGTRLIARDVGMVRLKSIEVLQAELATVTIRAGSIPGLGDTDITGLADQRIQLRGDAAATYGRPAVTKPLRDLVDNEFVLQNAPRLTRLFRLIFDKPHVIYADGLEIISHLPRLDAKAA